MKNSAAKLSIGLAICLIAVSGVFAQQNYKIKQTMSMNGQKSETTTYVRGSRKRTEGGGFMGMGIDVADVEQCDLKRNLKISDKKRMYAVEPFDDGAGETTDTKIQNPKSKIQNLKGGTVTLTSSINDTGERKQMFGLTARHIKTSMAMQGSPDACMKDSVKVETDGWYVDLPSFSCPITVRPQVPQMGGAAGGCRDKMIFKNSGGGKLGFPLTETRTMNMGDGDMSFTQTLETVEFSKATLDAALFDIPAGYKPADSAQDLYGKPDIGAMMKAMGGDDDDADMPKTPIKNNSTSGNSTPKAKKAGTIRIGVYAPTNKSGESISTTNLQSFLVQKLTGGSVEAVAVNSEADAKAASCDYVLSSDFSKLKQSTASKIGGMFGKVTNTDTSSARNYDAQIEYKLVPLSGGKAVSSKASNKSESDVDRAAEAALSQEVSAILSAVKP